MSKMDILTENIISVENICRTCMNEDSELIPLFNTFIENIRDKNLAEILKICTDLKVEQNDGLPSQICPNCIKDLNTAYNFKIQSLEANNALQEAIQKYLGPEIEILDSRNFDCFNQKLDKEEFNEDTLVQKGNKNDPIKKKNKINKSTKISNNYKNEKVDLNKDFEPEENGFLGSENPQSVFLGSENSQNEILSSENPQNEILGSKNLQNEYLKSENLRNEILGSENSKNKLVVPKKNRNEFFDSENEILDSEILQSELLVSENTQIKLLGSKNPQNEIFNSQTQNLRSRKIQNKKTKCSPKKINQSTKNLKNLNFEFVQIKTEPENLDTESNNFEKLNSQKYGDLDLKIANLNQLEPENWSIVKFEPNFENWDNDPKNSSKKLKFGPKNFKDPKNCEFRRKNPEFDLKNYQNPKEKYFCEKCGKNLSRNGFLKHRKKDCVPIYECVDCNIEFETRKGLRDHLRVHRGVLECKYCPMVFRSSYGLEYHLKRHEGLENYHCPFENCTKKFAMQRALDKHILTHSKEKSYLCSKCGKRFNTCDTLLYHIKTHDGNRPHLCTYCGKAFRQICHLKSHIWVHTGIKPYQCEKCKKCFTRDSVLKKHIKKICGNINERFKVV